MILVISPKNGLLVPYDQAAVWDLRTPTKSHWRQDKALNPHSIAIDLKRFYTVAQNFAESK